MKKHMTRLGLAAAFAAATVAGASVASAQKKDIVLGFQTDRTGPTANIGVPVGTGYNDNVDTSNSRSFTLADATTPAFTDSNRRKIFSTTTVIRNGS